MLPVFSGRGPINKTGGVFWFPASLQRYVETAPRFFRGLKEF